MFKDSTFLMKLGNTLSTNYELVDEISLTFRELFITGKYVKSRFKNGDHRAIFSVLEVER